MGCDSSIISVRHAWASSVCACQAASSWPSSLLSDLTRLSSKLFVLPNHMQILYFPCLVIIAEPNALAAVAQQSELVSDARKVRAGNLPRTAGRLSLLCLMASARDAT